MSLPSCVMIFVYGMSIGFSLAVLQISGFSPMIVVLMLVETTLAVICIVGERRRRRAELGRLIDLIRDRLG